MQELIRSALLKLNMNDFVKGLAIVVIVSILGALNDAIQTSGLAVAQYDWGSIEKVAITAGIGYLVKNLLTSENGKIFGRI
jgi:uncharacterized membrane protein YciS (DUF1049 family)